MIGLWFVLGPGVNRAEAYIDPGTGASLLSSLGLLLGVACTGIAIGFTQVKRCGAWLLVKVAARRGPKPCEDESEE